MKVHQQVVDADGQVQVGEHSAAHSKESVYQKPPFFSYYAKDGKKTGEQQQILTHQHNPLIISQKAAYKIEKNADTGRIIFKSNESVPHGGKLICGEHIFNNYCPVGKVVIVLQLQKQGKKQEKSCDRNKADFKHTRLS